MDIIAQIRRGDIRATARLLRALDDGEPQAREVLKGLYPYTGRAHVVGITGSPGVGKSTLTDQMIQYLRQREVTVGVVAVDPTSPFSGGAILGDRIRMQRHATDEGVFIRSLATRGHFGGLTASARAVINVLDAMGKDVILVETVGVGQDEVDIVHAAHTTIVITVPGLGDDIQAIKAGILEIGDLFVVNKADREGADRTYQDLVTMIDMRQTAAGEDGWRPQVFKTDALTNTGVAELMAAVKAHWDFLHQDGGRRLAQRLAPRLCQELLDLVLQGIRQAILPRLLAEVDLEQVLTDIAARKTDPYTVSDALVDKLAAKMAAP
ncbi:MAG: methylmalonyl Co-A mutase-associated GTPase MeaB [Desulfobacca sp.]|uniref:methylmalonyl Co-A mutase-associated GTPase MeaB n=1 Tax=Desulfobacca sp. TaxID=2067990 RepID=UPI00404A2B07